MGIFTVQCVCKYVKLVCKSIMEGCEGASTALSVLLSRFQDLPKICYYDDNCNLAKSIILRTLRVNDSCLMISDCFHYRCHKCNIFFGPDIYSDTRFHSTSCAESRNQQWNFLRSHIRFLSIKNIVDFLAIRAIFVNIRAYIRENFNTQDIDDSYFMQFIRNELLYSCHICME